MRHQTSSTAGPLTRFLAEDHARLDLLFQRSTGDPGGVDRQAYDEFRTGLLRHIGMEEKILFPEAQRLKGAPLPIAARLRSDHGALAALLMLMPAQEIIAMIRAILAAHNELEEGPGGLYETCDRLLGHEAEALLARLRAAPEPTLAPTTDKPQVLDTVRRIVERAGYRPAF